MGQTAIHCAVETSVFLHLAPQFVIWQRIRYDARGYALFERKAEGIGRIVRIRCANFEVNGLFADYALVSTTYLIKAVFLVSL